MGEFAGLSADHFAAYESSKWSSNVHNLARMKAKDALVAMCAKAEEGLADGLLHMTRAASDEIPNISNQKRVDSQWVFWFRDPNERKDLASFLEGLKLDQSALLHLAPQDKHAILAVVVREPSVWIGARIAGGARVDRKNVAAKLGKEWEREAFLEILKELPEGATIGIDDATIPLADATSRSIHEDAQALVTSDGEWHVGHTLTREEAMELDSDLADQAHRWLGALLPVYRFLAWSRQNDHIEAGRQIQQEKAEKRKQAYNFKPGDKVRVISGLFSGKVGVVQEIDTKAQVRVKVGKMSVVVSGSELTSA